MCAFLGGKPAIESPRWATLISLSSIRKKSEAHHIHSGSLKSWLEQKFLVGSAVRLEHFSFCLNH